MEQSVCIITQARMTSSRLPGKVLMSIAGKTILDLHLDRLQQTRLPIVVATTTNDDDDPIVRVCERRNIPYVRGSEHNVLSRFVSALQKQPSQCVVRVTSDCPLIDPTLILSCVEEYFSIGHEYGYVSNCFPRTYARGFDTEVFSAKMLIEADQSSSDEFEREHVTPRFWQNKKGEYTLRNIAQLVDHSAMRITLDTPDDFRVLERLILDFGAAELSQTEIENLLNLHPEIGALNAHVEQKKNPS